MVVEAMGLVSVAVDGCKVITWDVLEAVFEELRGLVLKVTLEQAEWGVIAETRCLEAR